MPGGPFRVFYSYSHADVRMLERLRTHLAMLWRHGLITEWYDRDIEAGSEWRDEIARELEKADVILLLVSADFLASDFCYEEEMLHAVERAERGEATVIGVMLRPVDGWESSPFARFQLLPRNARPITRWANADEAYSDVAAGIRVVLEERVRAGSAEEMPHALEAPRPADLHASSEAAARGAEIIAALRELQAEANVDAFIIVEDADPHSSYYTQCYADGDNFWCEAVSNQFLNPKEALVPAQMSQLSSFGWNPPDGDLPNWWCVQGDVDNVAALMVRTLREVYGVDLSAPLEIAKGS